MTEMIQAQPSQLHHYRNIPLYTKTNDDRFVLYKKSGMTLSDMRIGTGLHPTELYIDAADRVKGIQDVQRVFNRQLRQSLAHGKPEEIKEILVTILEETFSHPRSGSLKGMAETLEILVEGSNDTADVMINLARVSHADYSTAIHSINVMAFATAFCVGQGFSRDQIHALALSALLHDVGKAEMPRAILKAERPLTSQEFTVMKMHPRKGADIIRTCGFNNDTIWAGAEEHHEKLDGSGYPTGTNNISFAGKLLGIIDCYEALTSDNRPYRRSTEPINALKVIKEEAQAGKYDWNLFTKFAYTLT